MKSQVLLLLGIIGVLIVSGCSQFTTGTTNLQEVLSNKSNFVGKEITIKGILVLNLGPNDVVKRATGQPAYSIQDDQGYTFNIKPYPEERTYTLNKVYSVTGMVRTAEYCNCESKTNYPDGTGTWYTALEYGLEGKTLVEVCELSPKTIDTIYGKTEVSYRCKSDSKTNFYYLEASKPMTLL